MHTSELITAEIEGRYGFIPSFFTPALPVPEVLETLWRQTVAAYLDNTLPAMFKERLFAYLSRLRGCSYCVITHSCELRALGATGEEVFDLLHPPLGDGPASKAQLLGSGAALTRWPAPGSYVRDEFADPCVAELRRLLGPADHARLTLLLAHIDSCHHWARAHPEISYENDDRVLRHLDALMREEPRLRTFLHPDGHASAPARRDCAAAIVDATDDAIIGERKLRERYLQTVQNATRVLAQFGAVDETLHGVLRVIGEGMAWAVGSAWMPTRRNGNLQLRCAASWHIPALDGAAFETASRQRRLHIGECLPGRVWETAHKRWVLDIAAEPHARRADEARQDGLHTCCLLPVRGQDGVVAVFEFLSREIRPPDPTLLEMLNQIAGLTGEYLERKGASAPLATRAA